ncbi:hypothetical protein GIB67_007684 [Kingdonia uniflora]|uniref:Uncharacterized protein n=1 Tax=Kingdonia uniflora TaxID=39325 RepID=A0A7J7N1N6_9MAGN|nr:hypothetical protein GIB67_007684 [Kingdonia uniflora]
MFSATLLRRSRSRYSRRLQLNLYSGRAQLQIQTQCSTSSFQTTSNHIMKALEVEVLEAMTNLLSSSVIKIILGANPTPPSDSMLDIIFSTTSNHIIKPLEVEVLEAITTYSSLYSGRTRPQLQMQTFNLNFELKINQLNSYSGRARPTSYRSIIGTSKSIKHNTFYKLVIGSTSPTYMQYSIHVSSQSLNSTCN